MSLPGVRAMCSWSMSGPCWTSVGTRMSRLGHTWKASIAAVAAASRRSCTIPHHHFSWPGMVRECKPQHFSSTGSQVMLGAAPSDVIRFRVVRAEAGTCPQQQEHLCGAGGLAVEEGGASKGANHRAPISAHA